MLTSIIVLAMRKKKRLLSALQCEEIGCLDYESSRFYGSFELALVDLIDNAFIIKC